MEFFDLTKAEHEFLTDIGKTEMSDMWQDVYFSPTTASRVYTKRIEENLNRIFGDVDWNDSKYQDALNKYHNNSQKYMRFSPIYGYDNYYCRHLLIYVFENTDILNSENFVLKLDYMMCYQYSDILNVSDKGLLVNTKFILDNSEKIVDGVINAYMIIQRIGFGSSFSEYPKETMMLIQNGYKIFCDEVENDDDYFSYYFASELMNWMEDLLHTNILPNEVKSEYLSFLLDVESAIKEYLA